MRAVSVLFSSSFLASTFNIASRSALVIALNEFSAHSMIFAKKFDFLQESSWR